MTETLFLSNNSKVNMGGGNNTFGTFPGNGEGGTCPGATYGEGGCCAKPNGHKTETCYVHGLMKIYKAVGPRLKENTDKIVGKTVEEKIELFDNTITMFKKKNAPDKWIFRPFWSGDMDSEDTAKALVVMAKKHPDVKFWSYTRSYWWAHHFAGLSNYALYLSIDPSNKSKVLAAYEPLKMYNNINLAWMDAKSKDKPDMKFITCPSTAKSVMANGERRHCKDCRLCMTFSDTIKLRAITFAIH